MGLLESNRFDFFVKAESKSKRAKKSSCTSEEIPMVSLMVEQSSQLKGIKWISHRPLCVVT